MIVDAHLDLAYNALIGQQGLDLEPGPGRLVSRPALLRAGVGVVFATMFVPPAASGSEFRCQTPREAELFARAQLGYYESCGLPLVRSAGGLRRHVDGWPQSGLAAVLLMEGADPIVSPASVGWWVDRGVRIIGLAWARSRYSGGTAQLESGGDAYGLSDDGRKLLAEMAARRVILDLSHMSDPAVEEAFGLWAGPVIASHSNARALAPSPRQAPDWLIAEVGRRGGVVGISFYSHHLRGPDAASASWDDVVAHARHIADVAGRPEAVGIGSDLDGGFESWQSPLRRLEEFADLRIALRTAFSPAQVDGILGENWLSFLERELPPGE